MIIRKYNPVFFPLPRQGNCLLISALAIQFIAGASFAAAVIAVLTKHFR
jgi:hypothetical protein